MRRFTAILQTSTEPGDRNALWYQKGILKYYEAGEWRPFNVVYPEDINIKIDAIPNVKTLKEALDYLFEKSNNYKIVDSFEELDNLSKDEINYGTHCYVNDENKCYIYSKELNKWIEENNYNNVSPFYLLTDKTIITDFNATTGLINLKESDYADAVMYIAFGNGTSVKDLTLCRLERVEESWYLRDTSGVLPSIGQYVYIVATDRGAIYIPVIERDIDKEVNYIIQTSIKYYRNSIESIFKEPIDIIEAITTNTDNINSLFTWKEDIDQQQALQDAKILRNEEYAQELNTKIDAKVIEAGGVAFDLEPTQDSTNAVFSGGVYKYITNLATELESKTSKLESKTSEIVTKVIEEEGESIDIYSNNDVANCVFHLDENGLDAKNVKSNGKDVLTEHQDISMLATKEEVDAKQDKINQLSMEMTESDEEEQSWESDKEGEKYVSIGSYGIKAKRYFDLKGNPIDNIKTNVLVCRRNGTVGVDCDFAGLNAIHEALESITDNDYNNRYIIRARGHFVFKQVCFSEEGVDTTKNYWTSVTGAETRQWIGDANEWLANVYGKDYVTIDGGDKDETSVEVYLSQDTQFPLMPNSSTHYNGTNIHVVFNACHWAEFRNITFVGYNTRYCLHTESADESKESYANFYNCKFVYNKDYEWVSDGGLTIYNAANLFGAGLRMNYNWTFDKCTFIQKANGRTIGGHSGYTFAEDIVSKNNPAIVRLVNCVFDGNRNIIGFENYYSLRDKIILDNCIYPIGSTIYNSVNYSMRDVLDIKPMEVISNKSHIKFITNENKSFILNYGIGVSKVRVKQDCSAFCLFSSTAFDTNYIALNVTNDGSFEFNGYSCKDGGDGYCLGNRTISMDRKGNTTLANILGDCSVNTKTLELVVNDDVVNISLNMDYSSMSDDNIIVSLNNELAQYNLSCSIFNRANIEDMICGNTELCKNNDSKVLLNGMGVVFSGSGSIRAAKSGESVDGIVLSWKTPINSYARIATKGEIKSIFGVSSISQNKYYKIGDIDGSFVMDESSSNVKGINGIISFNEYLANCENGITNYSDLAGSFHSWGFIGDSLSSGTLEYENGSLQDFSRSWCMRMCKILGVDGYCFSTPGQTTKGWLNNKSYLENRTLEFATQRDNLKEAYIIALGENDEGYRTGSDEYYHYGLLDNNGAQVNVYNESLCESNIDITNYVNNKLSFAGYYARIIQQIREVNPRCFIFCVTKFAKNSEYNKVIRKVSSMFDRTFLIDLEFSNIDISKYKQGYHLSAVGYEFAARYTIDMIGHIMAEKPSEFKGIEFIFNDKKPK